MTGADVAGMGTPRIHTAHSRGVRSRLEKDRPKLVQCHQVRRMRSKGGCNASSQSLAQRSCARTAPPDPRGCWQAGRSRGRAVLCASGRKRVVWVTPCLMALDVGFRVLAMFRVAVVPRSPSPRPGADRAGLRASEFWLSFQSAGEEWPASDDRLHFGMRQGCSAALRIFLLRKKTFGP